jgi:hypothetical protein
MLDDVWTLLMIGLLALIVSAFVLISAKPEGGFGSVASPQTPDHEKMGMVMAYAIRLTVVAAIIEPLIMGWPLVLWCPEVAACPAVLAWSFGAAALSGMATGHRLRQRACADGLPGMLGWLSVRPLLPAWFRAIVFGLLSFVATWFTLVIGSLWAAVALGVAAHLAFYAVMRSATRLLDHR